MQVAAAVGRPCSDGSGRTVKRIGGDLDALLQSCAGLDCVPYTRFRCGISCLGGECAIEVAEGIAANFDLPACA